MCDFVKGLMVLTLGDYGALFSCPRMDDAHFLKAADVGFVGGAGEGYAPAGFAEIGPASRGVFDFLEKVGKKIVEPVGMMGSR